MKILEEESRFFLERLRRVVRGMGMSTSLREDLAQEAWLSCSEYATKTGRSLLSLSETEIRLRCFESRRSLLPKRLLVFGAEFEKTPAPSAVPESTNFPCPEGFIKDVSFLLQHHPALQLSKLQSKLWELHRENPRGRWFANKAKEVGCSRQNICNVLGVVRKKVEGAHDLVRLFNGDVSFFFEKYNTGWATCPIRTLLWSVLRHKSGVNVSIPLQERFRKIESLLFQEALCSIERENRNISTGRASGAKNLSYVYNVMVSAFHVNPESALAKQCLDEMSARISPQAWLLRRFVKRAGHIASSASRASHKSWLEERIQKQNSEGVQFAKYAMAYYGGVSSAETKILLESDGRFPVSGVDYVPIIQRLYDNICIPRYSRSATWMDINLLRIVLMEKYYPFRAENIPASSRNALKMVCQKSLHSRDSFVVTEGEKLLKKLECVFVPC